MGVITQLSWLSLGDIPQSRSGLANPSTVRRLSVFMKQNDLYRVASVRLASGVIAMVLAVTLGQVLAVAKPNIVFVLADDMGYGDVQALN
ncbi:uncharacterized protein METZ01_LOCUS291753, partial [marine metagenome]